MTPHVPQKERPETVHVINDESPTFDRNGYATRTRCGIRFKDRTDVLSVWPDDYEQGYVVAMNKRLPIPKDTRWCRRCAR